MSRVEKCKKRKKKDEGSGEDEGGWRRRINWRREGVVGRVDYS